MSDMTAWNKFRAETVPISRQMVDLMAIFSEKKPTTIIFILKVQNFIDWSLDYYGSSIFMAGFDWANPPANLFIIIHLNFVLPNDFATAL